MCRGWPSWGLHLKVAEFTNFAFIILMLLDGVPSTWASFRWFETDLQISSIFSLPLPIVCSTIWWERSHFLDLSWRGWSPIVTGHYLQALYSWLIRFTRVYVVYLKFYQSRFWHFAVFKVLNQFVAYQMVLSGREFRFVIGAKSEVSPINRFDLFCKFIANFGVFGLLVYFCRTWRWTSVYFCNHCWWMFSFDEAIYWIPTIGHRSVLH